MENFIFCAMKTTKKLWDVIKEIIRRTKSSKGSIPKNDEL